MIRSESKYYESESMFYGLIPHIMGTRFEILLIHSNSAYITKIWEDILCELEKLEKLLNRFDPESEVAQLNSYPPLVAVSIHPELYSILRFCQVYNQKTLHLFDVTLKDFSLIQFHDFPKISFKSSSLTLDFGGFAKGYALKKIRKFLLERNIQQAFINFGNSSIMGIGHHPYGKCWKVSLLNPYSQQPLDEFELIDSTLSTSGNTMQYTGHIINPMTGVYNKEKELTTIVSNDPLDAEVLSTVWMIADEKQRESIEKEFNNIQGTIYTV